MHEMGLVTDLFDVIMQETARHNVKKVKTIKLVVGEVCGALPESLQFAFEVVSKGTLAEGAKLVLDVVPLTARCKNCDDEFLFEQGRLGCPKCGSQNSEIIRGKELILDYMEVE